MPVSAAGGSEGAAGVNGGGSGSTVAAAGAGSSSKAVANAAGDKDSRPAADIEVTWQQRQKDRSAALKKLRDDEKKELRDAGKEGAKKLLSYLMDQADIFAHFVKGGKEAAAAKEAAAEKDAAAAKEAAASADAASSAAAEAAKAAGRKAKGRLTEKQEDEMMMRQEVEKEKGKAEQGDSTRLLVQPKCIQFGKMRDYQLEGLNWMIKLHDHGINGILADEMGERSPSTPVPSALRPLDDPPLLLPSLAFAPRSALLPPHPLPPHRLHRDVHDPTREVLDVTNRAAPEPNRAGQQPRRQHLTHFIPRNPQVGPRARLSHPLWKESGAVVAEHPAVGVERPVRA